jgi:hypothetical protein
LSPDDLRGNIFLHAALAPDDWMTVFAFFAHAALNVAAAAAVGSKPVATVPTGAKPLIR